MWMVSMKAVLDIVMQYCPDDDGSCSKSGVDLREMLDEIEGLDETEVEPIRHGHMIGWNCSECGKSTTHVGANWCPNCGAKIDYIL